MLRASSSTRSAAGTGADLAFIKLVRKSPLPTADIKRLSDWIGANLAALSILDDDALLEAITDQVLACANSTSLRYQLGSFGNACRLGWAARATTRSFPRSRPPA